MEANYWNRQTSLYRRQVNRRRFLAGGAAAGLGLLGLSLVGCSDDEDGGGATEQPKFTKDHIVWAHTGSISTFDPLLGAAQGLAYNLYEHLVYYKMGSPRKDGMVEWSGGGEVAPGLAESWDTSNNGATVTFHLRKGVKFYPSGNELTAEDVKWSFQRGFAVRGSVAPSNGIFAGIYKPDDQIQALDEYTVRFTFTDPNGDPQLAGASMQSLAFYMFPIWDSVEAKKRSTNEDGNRWAEKYVAENTLGTGPYYVSSYRQGVETILEYVGDNVYRGPAPHFKRVILRVFQNFADIVSLMKTGEVDGVIGMPIAELENLEAAGMQVIHQSTGHATRYFYALEHPQLKNKLVRQALAYAVPYDRVIDGIFGGRAERSYSVMNPKDPTYKPVLEKYKYDLTKAKDLLRQSGVTLPFDLTIFYPTGSGSLEDVSLLLKDAWSELGINASVSNHPTAQFNDLRRERHTALAAGRPTDVLSGVIMNSSLIFLDDPQSITEFWLYSKTTSYFNSAGFTNPEVDALHAEWGPKGADPEGRKKAYQRIQDIVGEELPINVVALEGTNLVLAQGLKNYHFVGDNSPRYWSLTA